MEFHEVAAFLKGDLRWVEDEIHRNCRSDIALIPEISGHLLKGGGKRFRPLLVLLSSKLCGAETNARVIKHACALEFIHSATLLHDDVVDETTVRRGNQTVNSKWGSDASILVGDYFISQSILLIAYDTNPRTIQAIAEAAKVLVEGGIIEFTKARRLDITEERYLDIIYRKTASIIAVSCQVGAILADADPVCEQALIDYGNNLGIAFQLIDDVMDYDSTEELLGKPVGVDFKEGHVTLPLLHLYQNANSRLRREIEGFIQNKHLTSKELDYIIDRMREGKAIEHTLDKAREYVDKAKAALLSCAFKAPQHRAALTAVADHVIERHCSARPALNQS